MEDVYNVARNVRANWRCKILRLDYGTVRTDDRGMAGREGNLIIAADAVNDFFDRHVTSPEARAHVRCTGGGIDVVVAADWNGRASCMYHSTFAEWEREQAKTQSAS